VQTRIAPTLFEPPEASLIIFIREEKRLAVVFARDRMRRDTRQIEAWFSWHFNILVEEVRTGKLPDFKMECCLWVLTP
jgi:hypothetical protein